jgi:hypothetical protein
MLNILTMEIVQTLFVIVKIVALSFLCASFIFTLEVAKSEGMILEKFAEVFRWQILAKTFWRVWVLYFILGCFIKWVVSIWIYRHFMRVCFICNL